MTLKKTLDELKNILSSKDLFGWKINVTKNNSYQLYFIKQELDMNRAVSTNEIKVTIYKKYDDLIGRATFEIFPSMVSEEIEKKIDEQIILSQYALCKPFELVKKQNFKIVEKSQSFGNHTLKEAAFIIADSIFEADKYDHGYVNSCEIFVNFDEIIFLDSNENHYKFSKSYCSVDIVTTWKEKIEVELENFLHFENLDSTYIIDKVNKLLLETRSRANAIPTNEDKNINVLLRGVELKSFFSYLVNKVSTDYIYSKFSTFDVGQSLTQKEEGFDKININLEAHLPNSTKNLPFDNDGVLLKHLPIIENGCIKNLWGSNQKSQYLNKPVKGEYQNIIVLGGSLESDDLASIKYIEIMALSDIQIDPLTGDFGGEIRLAYLHDKNKKIPMTGGSISGNIHECLDSIRISKEIYQQNNFLGPEYILINKVNLLKS